MRILDWLRGQRSDTGEPKPAPDRMDSRAEAPDAGDDWNEEDALPEDEDDPTVYPLW